MITKKRRKKKKKAKKKKNFTWIIILPGTTIKYKDENKQTDRQSDRQGDSNIPPPSLFQGERVWGYVPLFNMKCKR